MTDETPDPSLSGNPAQILHDLLVAGKEIQAALSVTMAWQRLLNAADESQAFARFTKVLALIPQIESEVELRSPKQLATVKICTAQIAQAFLECRADNTWDTFIGQIPESAVHILNMTAGMLRDNFGEVRQSKLNETKAALETALAAVLASSEQSDVKLALSRSIRQLICAIDEFFITGAWAVDTATSVLAAQAVRHGGEQLKEEKDGEGLWGQILSVINLADSITSMANNTVQLLPLLSTISKKWLN